jgi:hypothetical protein
MIDCEIYDSWIARKTSADLASILRQQTATVGKWNSRDRNSAPGIPRKFHRNSGVVKSGTGIPQNFNPIQYIHNSQVPFRMELVIFIRILRNAGQFSFMNI